MNDLQRALPLIAMVLGNKLGLTVTVTGDTAYTNGSHINIPMLPEDNKDCLVAVRGYLDHEAAHVRYTEMSANKAPGFVGHLHNVLEDVRIEEAMSQRYPGSRQNLTALADLMVRQNLLQLPEPDEDKEIHAAQLFMAWLNLKLQSEQLNYPAVKEHYEEADEVARAVFPHELLQQISDITAPVKSLQSAHETGDMADSVAQCIKDYIEQQKNQQPPPDQQAKPQKQEESESDGDNNQDDSGQGEEAAAGGNTNADSDSKGQDGSAGGNTGAQEGEQDDSDGQSQPGAGGADALQAILDAEDSDLDNQDKGKALARYLGDQSEQTQGDHYGSGAITIPETVEARDHSGINLNDVLGTSSQLRTRLNGLVQASKAKRHYPKRTGRRLDARYINRIPTGDLRVFSSRAEKTAVNTAICILIDRSSSMVSGNKMVVARESALAAAVGADAIPGTSVCVGAFPSGYTNGVIEVLPFGQSPRNKYLHFGVDASGGTPMREAMWWGAVRLLNRKEPRKIMLVATDGEANDMDAAKATIGRLKQSGVEMMGLGIKHHGVEKLFEDQRVIHTIEEMPAALIGMLQDKLRQ